MRVLLVTSWGNQCCGIKSHSAQLIQAVQAADPTISVHPSAEALDPEDVDVEQFDLIHLNYHAAVHSLWTPRVIQQVQAGGCPVIVTYHDTGVPNSDQCKALYAVADRFIVHEPAEDLPNAIYWRMGVPKANNLRGYQSYPYAERPILGTVGFDFGWKCFDELAKVTKQQGWGFTICCPEMSQERRAALLAINPWLTVYEGLDDEMLLATLRECDATAFTNVCHNTGQSAAILLGIAARKPVIALSTCRQYKALHADPLARQAIVWMPTFDDVGGYLRCAPLERFNAGIVALAEQESWEHLGHKYAALYQAVLL